MKNKLNSFFIVLINDFFIYRINTCKMNSKVEHILAYSLQKWKYLYGFKYDFE